VSKLDSPSLFVFVGYKGFKSDFRTGLLVDNVFEFLQTFLNLSSLVPLLLLKSLKCKLIHLVLYQLEYLVSLFYQIHFFD